MTKQQGFERLLKLEDEEINTENGDLDSGEDSCKVPMMSNEDELKLSSLETTFSGIKHNKPKHINSGMHFTVNGRRIQFNNEQLKYISLITLTIQNAALSLTMRAARTQKDQFSAPVAVTLSELLKLITCVFLIFYEERFSPKATLDSIKSHIFDNYIDTLKVAVPSFVYYVQNNLLYVGSTHLDAATGSVTYQLKILTTAIFSVLMLNKKLSRIQWIALVVLFFGVALIETVTVSDSSSPKNQQYIIKNHAMNESTAYVIDEKHHNEKPIVGFAALLIACCLSGFAGVYFEKILKNTSHISLWIRNIQLSLVTIPIGVLQLLFNEQDHLINKGLLYGFTPLTWLCIMLQVQGGLLVAVVVKFANNILKGFATSMSIVIATVASMFLFDFQLTPSFFLGASLVIGSVMMYNKQ